MRRTTAFTSLAVFVVIIVLAMSASASSQQYYHRTDAEKVSAARGYLDAHGLAGVTVRATRGRLTLGGTLPAGDRLANLERELGRATGAVSIHH